MSTDAFVLRFKADEFAPGFLASPDFDVATLKSICRDLNLSSTGKKTDLVDRIAPHCQRSDLARKSVMEHLVRRPKGWFSLKIGEVSTPPKFLDPTELVVGEGTQQWYGPLGDPVDDDVVWYIRPVLIPHFELLPDSSDVVRFEIRWLCFARVVSNFISLHWRGFTHALTLDAATRYNSQFHYWEHVPRLFDELQEAARAKLEYVNLHDLVLYTLWDKYRYDGTSKWVDRRIRAESGGVALTARTGAIIDIDVPGIRRLAYTIRRSIQMELSEKQGVFLSEPAWFDEVILRTLLREFGSLSYEFSLEDRFKRKLFRAHSYFGVKPNSTSPDSFAHLNVFTTWQDDLRQLQFILDHMDDDHGENNRSEQLSLFG